MEKCRSFLSTHKKLVRRQHHHHFTFFKISIRFICKPISQLHYAPPSNTRCEHDADLGILPPLLRYSAPAGKPHRRFPSGTIRCSRSLLTLIEQNLLQPFIDLFSQLFSVNRTEMPLVLPFD